MHSRAAALLGALTFSILVLGATTAALAQTYQGTIRGIVRDAQGIIPAAEVTLVNESTSAARTVITNEVGEYVFPSVLPGTYTLRASLPGFRTEERTGLQLATQQQVVQDFTLEVGGLTEQITVSGESPLVERATATVATSLTAKDITALPIFGRNTFYLRDRHAERDSDRRPAVRPLSGSVERVVPVARRRAAARQCLSGRRRLDHRLRQPSVVDAVDRSPRGHARPGEDLRRRHGPRRRRRLQRHRAVGLEPVARQRPLPQQARMVQRAAVLRQAGRHREAAAVLLQLGGLGRRPHRSRPTFFWFSKDDYLQRSTRNNVLTVPTALERDGDFSQSRNAAGQLIVIYDPLTTRSNGAGGFIRDPFPGNVIPANRLNPISRAMLANMPLPDSGRSFNGQATLDDGPQTQTTVKVDQRWSGSWQTTGMYGQQHTREPGSAFWGPHGTVAGDPGGGKNNRVVNFGAVNNICIPDNQTTVAVRYGYNHFLDNGGYYLDFDAASLGFPPSYTSVLPFNTFPNITLAGYGTGTGTTIGNNGPSLATHVSQTANATVTRLAGSHSLKFGADYRHIQAKALVYGSSAGAFTFNQGFTQGPTPKTASTAAGDAIASLLLGYPASGEINVSTPAEFLINYFSAYAQDDYRVSSSLTLNFGLRWEYEPGISEKDNGITVGFDRTSPFPVQVPGLDLKGGLMYAGVDGNPTRQAHGLNAFAPRGGFAWSVTEKTVIRGGYGLFWAPTMCPTSAKP